MPPPVPRKGDNPKLFAAKALGALGQANGRLRDCRAFYADVVLDYGAP